ncbi:Fibroblast growth factor 2, partial [Lamprotornis superbus]
MAAAAAGAIATLPDDGGSGAFPPGHFKDPKRLYCKNGGFFLRINPDGKVDGVREKSDPHIKLQLQAEERGVVSIKGVSANRFLAMKEDGRLLALKYATEECFFFERLESNNYNTYRSRKYSDWYVALKRTGQYKPGPKTGPGQKAILFLPIKSLATVLVMGVAFSVLASSSRSIHSHRRHSCWQKLMWKEQGSMRQMMYMSDFPKAPGCSCCCLMLRMDLNSDLMPVSSKTSRTAVSPGGKSNPHNTSESNLALLKPFGKVESLLLSMLSVLLHKVFRMFRPWAAASVPMSDLLIRSVSLHFAPRGNKMGKTFQKVKVGARSFSRARVRSVLTLLTTNAAGTLRVCRVCVLQLQPENHPSIQNSSREKIFLFNDKLKISKEFIFSKECVLACFQKQMPFKRLIEIHHPMEACILPRLRYKERNKSDFLSLHKHPCSFTCEDKLLQCSSAVLCWREMRSFLKPALFPTTGVPHVPPRLRPCTSPWPCAEELLVPTNQVKGVEGSKCIYFCFVHKNGDLEIFAQSVLEVTVLDSSRSREAVCFPRLSGAGTTFGVYSMRGAGRHFSDGCSVTSSHITGATLPTALLWSGTLCSEGGRFRQEEEDTGTYVMTCAFTEKYTHRKELLRSECPAKNILFFNNTCRQCPSSTTAMIKRGNKRNAGGTLSLEDLFSRKAIPQPKGLLRLGRAAEGRKLPFESNKNWLASVRLESDCPELWFLRPSLRLQMWHLELWITQDDFPESLVKHDLTPLIHTFVITWLHGPEAQALAVLHLLCGKFQTGGKPAADLLGSETCYLFLFLCWLPAGQPATIHISAFHFQDAHRTDSCFSLTGHSFEMETLTRTLILFTADTTHPVLLRGERTVLLQFKATYFNGKHAPTCPLTNSKAAFCIHPALCWAGNRRLPLLMAAALFCNLRVFSPPNFLSPDLLLHRTNHLFWLICGTLLSERTKPLEFGEANFKLTVFLAHHLSLVLCYMKKGETVLSSYLEIFS